MLKPPKPRWAQEAIHDAFNEPGGARTHDLRIKSLVGLGPKCGKNQCKTWVNMVFPRTRAPPIWEFPVPKLTHELTHAFVAQFPPAGDGCGMSRNALQGPRGR
jgi:hypothetical protein